MNYSTFQKGKDKSETSYQQIRPVATLETNLNSKTLHCHNNRFWDPKLTVKPQSALVSDTMRGATDTETGSADMACGMAYIRGCQRGCLQLVHKGKG